MADTPSQYPALPIRQAAYTEYGRVHAEEYLRKLVLMAVEQPGGPPPKLSLECTVYEFCFSGYEYGLGGMFEAVEQMKK